MKDLFKIDNLSKITLALLLFSITMFPKLTTILLVILLVIWLAEKDFKNKFTFLLANKIYFILPILFMCYLFGMLYTEDLGYGWKKIETSLTFFLVPIILPTLKSVRFSMNYKFFRDWYINGILVSMLFCVIRSIILFNYELYCRENNIELAFYPYTNYFFSSYLSYFMHYGYYSMYVLIGVILILEKIKDNFQHFKTKHKFLYFFLLLVLSVFVMMLYSKASILSLLLVFLSYGIYLAFLRKKKIILLYTFLGLLAFLLILIKFIPYTAQRFQGVLDGLTSKSLDPNSTESTQLRIFAWKTAKELIAENPWFGYGTGDGNNILIEGYNKRKYTGAYSLQINAHNQYYQTLLSIGVYGLLVLVIYLLTLFYYALKLKDFQLFIFTFICSFVMFFESYFSTQAGVFFISIISTFLLTKNKAFKHE